MVVSALITLCVFIGIITQLEKVIGAVYGRLLDLVIKIDGDFLGGDGVGVENREAAVEAQGASWGGGVGWALGRKTDLFAAKLFRRS
jgi:hypothetical protein